jgi:hypothetical protein
MPGPPSRLAAAQALLRAVGADKAGLALPTEEEARAILARDLCPRCGRQLADILVPGGRAESIHDFASCIGQGQAVDPELRRPRRVSDDE